MLFVMSLKDRNITTIHREHLTENFVILDKTYVDDIELSAKAKGVMTRLFSLPPNWKIIVEVLVEHFTDGYDSLKSAFMELRRNGYLEYIEFRVNGKIHSREFFTHAIPFELDRENFKPRARVVHVKSEEEIEEFAHNYYLQPRKKRQVLKWHELSKEEQKARKKNTAIRYDKASRIDFDDLFGGAEEDETLGNQGNLPEGENPSLEEKQPEGENPSEEKNPETENPSLVPEAENPPQEKPLQGNPPEEKPPVGKPAEENPSLLNNNVLNHLSTNYLSTDDLSTESLINKQTEKESSFVDLNEEMKQDIVEFFESAFEEKLRKSGLKGLVNAAVHALTEDGKVVDEFSVSAMIESYIDKMQKHWVGAPDTTYANMVRNAIKDQWTIRPKVDREQKILDMTLARQEQASTSDQSDSLQFMEGASRFWG